MTDVRATGLFCEAEASKSYHLGLKIHGKPLSRSAKQRRGTASAMDDGDCEFFPERAPNTEGEGPPPLLHSDARLSCMASLMRSDANLFCRLPTLYGGHGRDRQELQAVQVRLSDLSLLLQ